MKSKILPIAGDASFRIFYRFILNGSSKIIALAKKDISDSAIRRVMFEAGEFIDDLMILCRADITTKNPKKIKKYMSNFEKVEQLMKDVVMRDEMKAFKSPIDGYKIMKTFNIKEGKIIGLIKSEFLLPRELNFNLTPIKFIF